MRILPRRKLFVDEPSWEKARKVWPTSTILNEMFEFSEIYVCQKYKISGDSVCNLHNDYSVLLYLLYWFVDRKEIQHETSIL